MQDFIVSDLDDIKEKVEAIIFDFGGVIFNIDYQRPIQEFEKLGFVDFGLLYDKSSQSNLFDQLEIGAITPEKFTKKIKESAPNLPVTSNDIIHAWNAILLDIPKQRVELIRKLKKKYNVFLLSNTNQIHVERFLEIVDQTMSLEYFNSSFDGIYFSNEMGMRKPNPEIFGKVISDHNLLPSKTLFIDDSIQHIIGASKEGIYSYHLEVKNEDICELFKKW